MIKRVYFPLPSVFSVHLHSCFELGQIPVLGSPAVRIIYTSAADCENLLLPRRKTSKFSHKWLMSSFGECSSLQIAQPFWKLQQNYLKPLKPFTVSRGEWDKANVDTCKKESLLTKWILQMPVADGTAGGHQVGTWEGNSSSKAHK